MNSSVKYSDNDFYQVLGRITVAFATWDYHVTALILNLPSKGMSINDTTTLKQKLRILEDLRPDQIKNDLVLDKLSNILPEAIQLCEARNRYIHDHWVFNKDTISVGEIKLMRFTGLDKNDVKPNTEKLTISNLNIFLEEIIQMYNKFGILLKYLEPAQ